MEYYFDIAHRTGVKHQAADVLSRLRTRGTDQFDINDEISVMVVTTRVQMKLTKVQENAPKETHIETDEP